MIWPALGDVLPQAVAIAISPIPIVLVIIVLVSAPGGVKGVAFTLGWTTGVFATTAIAGAIAQGANVASDPDAADAGSLLQVALGVLFVFLAVRQWRRRPASGAEPAEPTLFSAIDSMSAPRILGIGAVAAVANPKNLPLTISAGVSIAQAGVGGADLVTATVVFSLIASAGIIGLVIVTLALGDRVRMQLAELKGWLLSNNATIVTVIFLLLGAKMLGSGLAIAG